MYPSIRQAQPRNSPLLMAKGNKKAILLVVWLVLLGGLLFGITHFDTGSGSSDTSSSPRKNGLPAPKLAVLATRWPEIVARAAAPPRGNPHVPYTMAEFGDFQCPQCGRVRPFLEHLLARYPKQVNMIFVHRPFPNIHPYALAAAEASDVAAAQGKFWPMYDALYEHQEDLEPGSYGDYAAKIGLNKAQFEAALVARTGKPGVDAATRLSDSLGVLETPTVVVHDNAHNVVTVYVGLSGADNPPGVSGIRDLIARPPWLNSHT
jgi:protein-disulfide isomerase